MDTITTDSMDLGASESVDTPRLLPCFDLSLAAYGSELPQLNLVFNICFGAPTSAFAHPGAISGRNGNLSIVPCHEITRQMR